MTTSREAFSDHSGQAYNEEAYHEIGQQLRANELTEERQKLLKQARDGGNHRHLVAEGYEMGIL